MEFKGIAIVGLAAQLPSGSSSSADFDYMSFWDFLVKGGKAYEPLQGQLTNSAQAKPQVNLPAQGTFLKNATTFDNISLGISIKDARVIPYSGRRLLDLSFQALLDSGIESRGRNIGCFMSGNRPFPGQSTLDPDGSVSSWMPHSIANRISYALDLTGPSIYLDTACSSSLTALHLAIGAIERGDCAAALVGAAQINRDPFEWAAYMQGGGILSLEGMCRPFDAAAAGFGRGEGAVVVVLKPVNDAIQDKDHIYSVVLGSAVNSTGSRMPLNVPNGVAQQKCIREAYRRAGVDPRDADYVELHATGTSVGDPIEANAAGQIFATDGPAVFGSVKGNIAHLEVAAFLASLVKACLIFEHGIIPPTVNFLNPARAIDWEAFQVVVPVEPTSLGCRSSSGRPIISLSGFALGGATGHVVLQAPPLRSKTTPECSTAPVLFIVGGLSSDAVHQISRGILDIGTDDPRTLRECAATVSRRARQLPWRNYFTVPPSPHTTAPALVSHDASLLIFVFSGQGPQHLEMGRQLFAEYPVFRNTIAELDDVYCRVRGVSLVKSTGLFAPVGSTSPTITLPDFAWPVAITLSALAMVQMAMFDLLKSVGIVPDEIMGHSAGEAIVLYASGAGPKEMAMEVAIARGETMTCAEGERFGMATLACNASRAAELIARVTADLAGVLELSCFNAPDSVAVSGTATLLDKLVTTAKHENILAQRLRTMVPFHSSFMNSIKDDFLARMDAIFARYPGSHAPRIPVYSTSREDDFDVFTASYFWNNCRNAVLFSKAISKSLASSSPVFLEISCHAVLSPSILAQEVPASRVLCPMRRVSAKKGPSTASTEPEIFLDTLGRLSLLGLNSLDLSGLYGSSSFTSKLIEHPLAVRTIPPPKSLSPLLRSTASNNGPLSSSKLLINETSHPDLAEHVVDGEPLLPATGFIELLLESGANFLWDVEFNSILSLASDPPLEIGLRSLESAWSVTTTTASCSRDHARGFMDTSGPNTLPPAMDCESIVKRLPVLDFEGFYASTKPLTALGPRFQRVMRCHGGPLEAIAEIRGPTPDELSDGYLLHPVIMEACIHVIHHPDISKRNSKDIMYFTSRLEHFSFYRRKYGAGNWFSHISLRQWMPECRYYDVLITDSSGLALCELRNLIIKHTSAAPLTVDRRFDLIFQPVAANASVPTIPTFFPERTDEDEIQLLYETLDSLAVTIISNSLDHDLVIGEDESSHRYLNFAHRALKTRRDVQLSPETLQNLKDRWPHHFEITRRISVPHDSAFETPKRAIKSLYSDDLMAKYYSKSSQTSNVCIEATKAFSGVLQALRRSGKQAIRILEVGAGAGLLTYHLIDEVKQNSDLLVEYTVTDITYALVADLARNISYGSIIPKTYNIAKEPDAQGIRSESYDVVVAHHALHMAPSVKASLASLQGLLVPGGCLLTVELDGTAWEHNPGSVWFDCVFGSFSEWFGYTDGRYHCAMAPATWKDQLEAVDFINVQTCVESGGRGRDFFFVAQKSLSRLTPAFDSPIDLRHIYSYEVGQEMELQAQLRSLDTTVSITVYLLAIRGQAADAALGLCAVLRQEIPLWDIRLCIFESSMDLSNPTPLLIRYMGTFNSGENVVSFDRDGAAQVPRVALSVPPSSTEQRAPAQAVDDPSYISIRVGRWAGLSHVFDGFVGQVAESHHPSVSAGDFVGGVVEPSSAELIRAHINSIIPTTQNPDVNLAAQLLGNILLSIIPWPSSGSTASMAVAIADGNLVQIISQHLLKISGIHLVLADFRDPATPERLDIVISDSATYAQFQHLRRWVPRGGKIFLWDTLLTQAIRDDQFYVRRALAAAFPVGSVINPREDGHIPLVTPPSIPRQASFPLSRSRASPPFRNDRTYVLLGGIGGLGIDLAVWMYQRGARHLVLTSRRGLASLDPIGDALILLKVGYLQRQGDLELRLEKCDATDDEQMKTLLHRLPAPIAGCFHMTLVVSWALFFNQTRDTFSSVYNSKIKVLEVFSAHVEMESLDFFVALSSINGLVGVPGASNYDIACTALDGALSRYPNAFSLITPGILESGYLDRTGSKHSLALMSAQDLWVCLEDGLRKLDDRPFNQYIPDLDWTVINHDITLPMTCRHLLSPNSGYRADPEPPSPKGQEMLPQVLELLEVSFVDFDVTQPLTIYGLDSISAAKLSSILRPYGYFSQMRLLGGTTWAEIETQCQSSTHIGTPGDTLSLAAANAARREAATQPLVEICGGSGTPLILLPGGTGSIAVFFALQEHFQDALWAIQITESTPMHSFETLVGFWKQQICEKRPHGPYRLAAYSASTLLAVALTKMMEDAGEEVLQLTFIDHCPMLWAGEEAEALLRDKTGMEFNRDLVKEIEDSIVATLRHDPAVGPEILERYESTRDLPDAAPAGVKVWRAVLPLIFAFLRDFYPADSEKTYDSFMVPFRAWMFSVKAPLAVLVAEHGIVTSRLVGAGWPDLGASRFSQSVEVHYISGVGHFGLLEDKRVAQILKV
ncbi:hypothetical protein B0H10DRAFT_369055 [Mycena sp. CBHHK59/15]|nr:hypothetical protein B0H10DRAFT_369055 [Mycena sp. CBHHK59/15]